MPFLAPFVPLIAGGVGALLGGVSKSGNQGGVTQQQQQNQNVNKQESGSSSSSFSSPLMQAFQNQLMPQIQSAISQAQQPVYGEAQKANYLGGLNSLANSSIESLKQNLARAGALNSGRLSQGITDINMNRNNQASQFFSQIPILNRQATMSALPGLFGAGNQLTANAPRSSTFNDVSQSRTVGTNQGTTTQQGAPWWKNFLGRMGGLSGFLPGSSVSTGFPGDIIPGGIPGGPPRLP